MKRFLLLAAILIAAAAPAAAQLTAVSATVTDPNGLAYAGGTVKAVLTTPGGPSPSLNNAPFTTIVGPVPLDSNGAFALNLADNNVVLPAGTQWAFTVCMTPGTPPPVGQSGCFTVTLTITGASQSISTQLSGSAISLSRVSGGGVTIATAGQGGFYPVFITYPTNAEGAVAVTAANQVRVCQFVLPYKVTVRRIVGARSVGQTGQQGGVGIYDVNGNRLLQSGALDMGALTYNVTITAVTLNAGVYFFAWTVSSTTPTLISFNISGNLSFPNSNANRVGNAANASSAGVLPATLGVITADNTITGIPEFFFEP